MKAVDHQPDEGLEADERALIEATLSLLQLDGAWPSFDELDKYADNRLGIPNADLRALLAHPDPWADPVYTEGTIETIMSGAVVAAFAGLWLRIGWSIARPADP